MDLKSVFRKVTGKPYQSFAEVDEMVTRGLPVPDAKNNWVYIQFIARQDKKGRWNIFYNSNDIWYLESMAGFKMSQAAVDAARKKHSADDPVKDKKMNFDAAFLVLRELEEAHLKRGGFAEPREPSRHYMQAYRFLPRSFREGLDDLYQTRLMMQGEILPPKTPKPANKPQEGPKYG